MNYLSKFIFCIIIVINSYPCVSFAQNKEIYINGSNTVNNLLFVPHQEAIERRANVVLKIVVNGSNNGLRDLALGRCDIAMISAPLNSEAKFLNEKIPGFIHLELYKEFKIGESSVVFIVNKNNPIDHLSLDQLRRICIGDILNWKGVGGKDSRILFFTTHKGDGVRTVVQEQLLKGDFFGVYTTQVYDNSVLTSIVSVLSEAIGISNIQNTTDSVKVVQTDVAFIQPLILVTRTNPSSELETLIKILQDILNDNQK